MSRICKVAAFVFIFTDLAFAQVKPNWFGTINKKALADSSADISVITSGEARASSVGMQFMSKFVWGGLIDNDLKQLNAPQQKKLNRAGVSESVQLSYWAKATHTAGIAKRQGFQLGFSSFQGAQFTSSAWLMVFYGNSPYAGQELDFSKSGYRNISWANAAWQFSRVNATKTRETAFSAGLYGVLQNNQIAIDKGSLYTDTGGTYIDAALQGNWSFNKKVAPAVGFSVSITEKVNDNFSLHFQVNDLGLVLWNKGTESNQFDTAFRFTGFYIPHASSFADEDFWKNKTDSLTAPLSQANGNKTQRILPASVMLHLNRKINKQNSLIALFSYRYGIMAIPEVKLAHRYEKQMFTWTSAAGYGGWGGWLLNGSASWQTATSGITLSLGGFQSLVSEKIPFQAYANLGVNRRF